MGPMNLLSGAPSVVGSGSESEWGREYEDEDTWWVQELYNKRMGHLA